MSIAYFDTDVDAQMARRSLELYQIRKKRRLIRLLSSRKNVEEFLAKYHNVEEFLAILRRTSTVTTF